MPTPWDVMQLSPAQALTISYQSCGVQIAPSELRDTYGRSFVIKELAKFNQDCGSLFPQDSKIVRLPRMASIFEEPGFVTPNAPQHKFGAQREYRSPGMANTIDCNWHRSRLPCISKLPTWESAPLRHSLHIENVAEALARVARQVSGRESTHGLKVLDRVPAKVGTGSPWPRQMTFAVGRPLGLLYVMFRQAALAACLSFGATRSYAACLVLATFGTYTLPLSVPKPAHASK